MKKWQAFIIAMVAALAAGCSGGKVAELNAQVEAMQSTIGVQSNQIWLLKVQLAAAQSNVADEARTLDDARSGLAELKSSLVDIKDLHDLELERGTNWATREFQNGLEIGYLASRVANSSGGFMFVSKAAVANEAISQRRSWGDPQLNWGLLYSNDWR